MFLVDHQILSTSANFPIDADEELAFIHIIGMIKDRTGIQFAVKKSINKFIVYRRMDEHYASMLTFDTLEGVMTFLNGILFGIDLINDSTM